MHLFSFASRNTENILRGIEARTWAVATVSESAMKARITKAQRYLSVGSYGILYCNATHSFTTPFIVASKADPVKIVLDIWPQPWVLPFAIRPLGNLSRLLHKSEAYLRWPMLAQSPRHNISADMNITGTTVFVPKSITAEDWQIILEDLATES